MRWLVWPAPPTTVHWRLAPCKRSAYKANTAGQSFPLIESYDPTTHHTAAVWYALIRSAAKLMADTAGQ